MATVKDTEFRYQSETIVRFDETGNPARVYTASKRVADKLMHAGLNPTKIERLRGEDAGWYFECDPGAVLVKPGASSIRLGIRRQEVDAEMLTDGEKLRRAASAERLREARLKRSAASNAMS